MILEDIENEHIYNCSSLFNRYGTLKRLLDAAARGRSEQRMTINRQRSEIVIFTKRKKDVENAKLIANVRSKWKRRCFLFVGGDRTELSIHAAN